MAKVLTGVNPGQVSEAQAEVIAGAPAAELQERTPQAGPSSLDDLLAPAIDPATPAPVATEAVAEGIGAGLEAEAAAAEVAEAERVRQEIRPVQERINDTSRVDRWGPKQPDMPETYGGIFTRANALGDAVAQGTIRPRFGTEASRAARAEKGIAAPLFEAANASGAVVNNTIDPDFAKMASIVTENVIANAAHGETDYEANDAIAAALGEQSEVVIERKPGEKELPKVAFSTATDAKLGQDIHAEYSRMKNVREGRAPDQFEKLSQEQAATLGHTAREMFSIQNPDMVQRFETPGGRTLFQLTGTGADKMAASAEIRKRMFPTNTVRPAKAPVGRLPGDIGRQTKPWSGVVSGQEDGAANTLKAAARNLGSVPNVVDKQRAKILLTTVLPILAGQQIAQPLQDAYSEINNIGPSKDRKFAAAKKDQDRRRAKAEAEGKAFNEKDYDPVANKEALIDKIAQEVRAVAMERDGANYLTYAIAAFNGRMAPQQSYFDPTASKAVRFVTRNAVPAKATKGNRVYRNLQQMYAMMLVPGADSKLPQGRVEALEQYTPQLRAWGKRLTEVLENSMTDAEYEAVSQAIAEGIPLTDPKFPQVKPLALDPEQDADLINAIKKKGEDGPHFIDGVIDFFNFDRHMRADRPYHSYFNAYMDGKTNGLASNGIQMGHEGTALATGVIRTNKTDLLDDGDIRDQLKDTLLQSIEEGWDGDVTENIQDLNTVARVIFGHRDLNKATTMTFGYGKEIASFAQDIETTIGELYEEAVADPEKYPGYAAALEAIEQEKTRDELAGTLLNKYAVGLANALSSDALQSRTIMRSAAMLHAITDTLFTIKSYTGFDLHLGRPVTDETQTSQITSGLEVDGKNVQIRTPIYENRGSSAAIRSRMNKEGVLENIPGEWAYGGSLPGPVQSLDAATVAMTSSGNSWKKLRAASNGNPYLHTIYDAFKVDAMGYDVVLDEVNKNWLEAAMEWSYLKETQKSLQDALKKFNADYAKDNPERKLTAQESEFMHYFLDPSVSNSGRFPSRLMKRIRNLIDRMDGETTEQYEDRTFQMTLRINKIITGMGYKPGEPVTAGMRYVFYREMVNALEVSKRLDAMIRRTEANKAELKKKIKASGPVYQYYAH